MRIPEIQGLRALAVILVVAFHANFLSGGFLGVDIFYVISGYLITGLLIGELRATGSISLSKFYARRIKRLLPTSFLVLLVTAVVSFFVMPPGSRTDLGRNIIATTLYVSNYLLAWWQSDYQNLGTAPSPLVHFWSLAVEEQFYLFWPLLILAFARAGIVGIGIRIGRVVKAMGSITLISLFLSLVATTKWPIWSFYSLPTRAWELGAGALLVFYRPKRVAYKWSAWIALALILITSFTYSDGTAFPGTAALVPILAASLLIFKIEQLPAPLSKLFRTRFVQWVGNISYPLYLWHWPLLSFAHVMTSAVPPAGIRMAALVLSFALAWLTYRLWERPIRFGHKTWVKTAALCAAMGVAGFIG
ncbi:MAG: acyltransferase, partial [Actinobacteria bacterium]|nr:acyltransferase [Actinomycetota bacterium]